MKSNAENFIDLVAKLYSLNEKQIQQMEANIPEINEAIGQYDWQDVQNKTNLFFSRKNDKSRPHIAQILAMLESDPNVHPLDVVPDDEPDRFALPRTRLWSIRDTFDRLVRVLVDAGVIPNEDGKFHNIRSLVDPVTNGLILNPQQWLKWQLQDVLRNHPDYFVQFQFASPLEQLSVALQNKLITFKVRDWAKLSLTVGGNK